MDKEVRDKIRGFCTEISNAIQKVSSEADNDNYDKAVEFAVTASAAMEAMEEVMEEQAQRE